MFKDERVGALKRIIPVFCIFVFLAVMLVGSAGYAVRAVADNAEASGNTITIINNVDGEPVDGMSYSIYKAAERVGGKFELYGDFADCPVSLNELDDASAQDAADTLEVYARNGGYAPIASAVSDAEGIASAAGLGDGVYLISGEKLTVGSKLYTPMAILVEIAGEDVEVHAKIGAEDVPQPVEVDYKVIKLWQNEVDESARPAEIAVELYKNGELYDTVTLNAENDWAYEWKGLEDEEWSVVEKDVADSYTVTYRNEGAEFAVINTYNKPDDSSSESAVDSVPSSSDVSSEDSLSSGDASMANDSNSSSASQSSSSNSSSQPNKVPQTGQLWWPVPILCVAGLVFVAAGIRVKKRSGK